MMIIQSQVKSWITQNPIKATLVMFAFIFALVAVFDGAK